MKDTTTLTLDATDETAAKSNPRAISTRIVFHNKGRAGGQRAHDLRLGNQPAYVQTDKSKDNRVLVEPLLPTELWDICVQRRSLRPMKRSMRSNVSIQISGLISMGKKTQDWFQELDPATQDEAMRWMADKLAERLNTTLTGLVVHVDETAVHAHYQMPAYCLSGKPIHHEMNKHSMSHLQDVVHAAGKRYMPLLERGHKKQDRIAAGADPADTVHRKVSELHNDLGPEIEERKAELQKLLGQVADAQTKLEKNSRLLQKAESGQKRVKEKTRAAYKRRIGAAKILKGSLDRQIQDKNEEIARLEAALTGLNGRETKAKEAAKALEAALAAIEAAAEGGRISGEITADLELPECDLTDGERQAISAALEDPTSAKTIQAAWNAVTNEAAAKAAKRQAEKATKTLQAALKTIATVAEGERIMHEIAADLKLPMAFLETAEELAITTALADPTLAKTVQAAWNTAAHELKARKAQKDAKLLKAGISATQEAARTAKTNAEAAKEAAETAKKDADGRKADAEEAITAANNREAAARTAQTDAETAKTNYETAQKDADDRKADAEEAKTAADNRQAEAQKLKAGLSAAAELAVSHPLKAGEQPSEMALQKEAFAAAYDDEATRSEVMSLYHSISEGVIENQVIRDAMDAIDTARAEGRISQPFEERAANTDLTDAERRKIEDAIAHDTSVAASIARAWSQAHKDYKLAARESALAEDREIISDMETAMRAAFGIDAPPAPSPHHERIVERAKKRKTTEFLADIWGHVTSAVSDLTTKGKELQHTIDTIDNACRAIGATKGNPDLLGSMENWEIIQASVNPKTNVIGKLWDNAKLMFKANQARQEELDGLIQKNAIDQNRLKAMSARLHSTLSGIPKLLNATLTGRMWPTNDGWVKDNNMDMSDDMNVAFDTRGVQPLLAWIADNKAHLEHRPPPPAPPKPKPKGPKGGGGPPGMGM